ncbi:DUF3653 domain-containing protein [Photobacterium sp. CCB-ST2H9]|uniref:DUF3653 domain-containing protein n=1 Tax=Photobacterium sp. CCB-ST2H9 TaxID=2912855 RepID=UPI0020046FDB|nr:DUF3653 domain-containing protein [Photobacterium sp. CCB-ST2H9]UTM60131.1 DUF3653 domain-containing protein [Photobacterium sp. CCB-ST2H9]
MLNKPKQVFLVNPNMNRRYYATAHQESIAVSDTMTRKISDNYIFRKFKCGLSRAETAKLCFKSVRTITRWDAGQEIPPECRRLMKMYSGCDLETIDDAWRGWRFIRDKLITPGGWSMTPERIITGNALMEIDAESDRRTKAKIIKAARQLRKIPIHR